MSKKLKGKCGFYPVPNKLNFYIHYDHKKIDKWLKNKIKALWNPEEKEIIVYSERDKEFLFIKGELKDLFTMGKVINKTMRIDNIIDKFIITNIFHHNTIYSRLQDHLLCKTNPNNFKLFELMVFI